MLKLAFQGVDIIIDPTKVHGQGFVEMPNSQKYSGCNMVQPSNDFDQERTTQKVLL